MTDEKKSETNTNRAQYSAAEEAAAIFRAAEEASRRAQSPYQTAVGGSATSTVGSESNAVDDWEEDTYDDDDEYEDDDEDEFEEEEPVGDEPVLPKHSPTEIRFINRTNIDEEDVRRLVERIFDGRKGVQGYRIFLLLFSALVAVYSIYNIVKGLTVGPFTFVMTGAFLLVMGGLMFWMGFKGVVNQTYKRTLKNAQGFMTTRTYHFYETDFSQTTEAQSYSVGWDEVASWTEDESSFYIIIGQSYAIVHKDGFTMGDEMAFRDFLTGKAERRVDLKRRF